MLHSAYGAPVCLGVRLLLHVSTVHNIFMFYCFDAVKRECVIINNNNNNNCLKSNIQ